MIGRRAVIGLSLLSALVFCAFAAQSASAAAAKNTTAFTCVSSGGSTNKDFKDAHCDEQVESGKGSFEHKTIPLKTATEIDVTQVANAVLKSKVAGAKVTIECTVTKNNTTKSTLENSESGKEHFLKGVATVEYSKCTVKELLKCIVAEPIVAEANVEGVEGLVGPKAEEKAMGLEFKGKGAEETFATIEFKDKEKEECSVKNQKFPVKGSAIGTSGPTAAAVQNNRNGGSTLAFTGEFEMEKLKLGTVETATFTSIVTPFMSGEPTKPVSTTTLTP
jgi:hypothetical protein